MPSCNKGVILNQSEYKLNVAAILQCRSQKLMLHSLFQATETEILNDY
jgi:hypothetical protein